jgi:hypothetical protein
MKKASAKKNNNRLRPEYDLSKLKSGVWGKHYRQTVKPKDRTRSLDQLNITLGTLQRKRLDTLAL